MELFKDEFMLNKPNTASPLHFHLLTGKGNRGVILTFFSALKVAKNGYSFGLRLFIVKLFDRCRLFENKRRLFKNKCHCWNISHLMVLYQGSDFIAIII